MDGKLKRWKENVLTQDMSGFVELYLSTTPPSIWVYGSPTMLYSAAKRLHAAQYQRKRREFQLCVKLKRREMEKLKRWIHQIIALKCVPNSHNGTSSWWLDNPMPKFRCTFTNIYATMSCTKVIPHAAERHPAWYCHTPSHLKYGGVHQWTRQLPKYQILPREGSHPL